MELISRTMQDMQTREEDLFSESIISEQTTPTMNKFRLTIVFLFIIRVFLVYIGHINSGNIETTNNNNSHRHYNHHHNRNHRLILTIIHVNVRLHPFDLSHLINNHRQY